MAIPAALAPFAEKVQRTALWNKARVKLEPQLLQLSQTHRLDVGTVAVILIGGLCLVLILLALPFTWTSLYYAGWEDIELMEDGHYGSGLEWTEGKVIGTVVLAAVIAVGLALFLLRRLLPAALVVAAAAGTCSLAMLFSLMVRYRVWRHQEGLYAERLGEQVSGGLGVVYYLVVLLALTATAAFLLAGLRRPLELPILKRWEAGPFTQRYGGLIGAQAAAVLFGLVLFAILYE